MEPEKSIALRPRFEETSSKSSTAILEKAKLLKKELVADYQIKIIDDHIGILVNLSRNMIEQVFHGSWFRAAK